MKNKKGFTLIELLAVIVILAIIMVIAVPRILDVIESSRTSAARSSIELVKDAIKTQVTTGALSGTTFEKTEECYVFNFADQESGNANKLALKNKEKIGGSIKYCNGKFEEDTLTFDGKTIDTEETPTTPVEPEVIRVDLKPKMLDGSASLTNMTATASGDNVLLSSPYGSDGYIDFNGDFSNYNFTKMYVKGHRNTGDSSFNHLFLYYSAISGDGRRETWYPSPGEDFEYTLEIPEGTKIKIPSFSFCVGEMIIEELYLE